MVTASEVRQILDAYLPEETGYAGRVKEAVNYSVRIGGKRLRPIFLLEVADRYGAPRRLSEPMAAALEMIHNYSLVHDDLPEMDNDVLRRGNPTTHKVYGQGMAVLAGDALLNLAFETALKAAESAEDPAELARVLRALRILADNAGIAGMVGGQCADLEAENGAYRLLREGEEAAALLEFIHIGKTAALIDSALTIGAVLGGAPEADIEALHQAARRVGTAFQIRDDILDVESDAETLGKTVGKDARDGKLTYVSVHGLETAKRDAERLSQEAAECLDSLSVPCGELREALLALADRRM